MALACRPLLTVSAEGALGSACLPACCACPAWQLCTLCKRPPHIFCQPLTRMCTVCCLVACCCLSPRTSPKLHLPSPFHKPAGVRNTVGFDWDPRTGIMYFGFLERDWQVRF